MIFCHPIQSKRPSRALQASSLKTVKEIPNFLLRPSSSACLVLFWGLRYYYGFERCHELWSMCGDQRVSERERASVSLGPDPQAGASLLLGLTGLQDCFWPPWWGGAVHTLCRPCSMLFSLLTQTQVTVSMLAEQEVCFSDPMDGANVIACVGRLMIGALVFLGSRPIRWLSSTIGYRERGQEGW